MGSCSAGVEPRVLSIQSHTVHGYVGNKCAVFPLQLFGFDVDAINSVQFSNHTGYPQFKGQVMNGEQLWELIEGLKANNLVHYTHLLTGYIGSPSLLETVVRVVETLRQYNPHLLYVCDPVMGDHGKLYVKPEMVAAFRDRIVPLASTMTPNQFEAEQLTGLTIRTEADALQACQALHDRGPSTVVVTSMFPEGVEDTLLLVASTTQPQCPQSWPRLKVKVPRKQAYFTGTGDLLSALLLAWTARHPDNLRLAVEKALAGLQCVLRKTAEACPEAVAATDRTAEVSRARELRLVQNGQLLLDPEIILHAERL
ncbi:hypothetical protein WJX72_008930 [[Myrmecia] bisecta]|uniref:pyridoxal kinase n=1 Tax=[Myrmecia] bisecta TaxID=41462 RepID=A0AAW1Q7Z3_9CHLO